MRVGLTGRRAGVLASAGAALVAVLALHASARAAGGQPIVAPQPGLRGVTRPTDGPHAAPHVAGGAASSATAPIPGQLVNHGGPVMASNTVYAMYWKPGGTGISSGFSSTVDGFFSDVAADSGKTSNVFADAVQYGAGYDATFGGSAVDSDGLPGNGCSSGPICLTTDQIGAELENFQSTPGWSGDAGAPASHLTKVFFIFLPQGVTVCFDSSGDACSVNSSSPAFCGYHTYGWDPSIDQTWVIAVMPYGWEDSGCDTIPGYPSGNTDADAAINVASHEYMEAITDPKLNAWYDSGGNEVGDKCAWTFGTQLGNTAGQDFNQEIGSGDYQLQLEYSNKLQDCFQVGPPTLTSLDQGSGSPGDAIGITGTGFFGNVGVLFNNVASSSVTVDSPTHLTVTVPSGNYQGHVRVDALGGSVTSTQTFGARPVVTGLSETEGYVGDTVTVDGSGFFSVKSVKIGGVAGSFSSLAADGTSVKVKIPPAAVSGQVTVTNAFATSTDPVMFTVDPKVVGVSPVSGVGLANVTVSGSGLGGATEVDFNGDASPHIVSDTATSVVVQVPVDATNGHVTVTTGAGTSLPSTAVFKPLPKVTSVTGDPAQVGDTVTVNGYDLTANAAMPTVKLGATVLSPGSVGATSFTVTVPDGVVTGSLSVGNGNGTATATLHVRPTISGAPSPSDGVAGTVVTLTGNTFTGTSHVTVGGVTAGYSVVNSHQLRVTVPTAAVTGPIVVVNAGGQATSSTFTVDPKITSFSPSSAHVGSTITISGTGLAGATEVDFGGGVSATPTSSTATSVHVVVPAGATTGPLTVHTASSLLTATSTASLTVT